jgi:predicted ArsR family transcriptional regulator
MYKVICTLPRMRDVLLIDDPERADVLVRPGRAELLQRLLEPRSCSVLAQELGSTPQKVHYHVKALENAGLVEQVSTQRVRGFTEASYQAAARSYWLSPRLVQRLGGPRTVRSRTSMGFLLDLAEEVHIEVGQLAGRSTDTPTIAISAQVALRDAAQRQAFLNDLQAAVQGLAEKYGGPATIPDATYRLAVACYPKSEGEAP